MSDLSELPVLRRRKGDHDPPTLHVDATLTLDPIERITAIEAHLKLQDKQTRLRTKRVDQQFEELKAGQEHMLKLIQALPVIPPEDALYLHTLANEWPHERVEEREEHMTQFDAFMASVAPLVPLVEQLALERRAADARAAQVAKDLVIAKSQQNADTLHMWETVHTVVKLVLTGAIALTGTTVAGALLQYAVSGKLPIPLVLTLLIAIITVAVIAFAFVSTKLQHSVPIPSPSPTVVDPD
jgi:hypothetical protein